MAIGFPIQGPDRLAALNENPGLDFSILKEWNYAK